MHLHVDLELPEMEKALGKLLPGGVKPTSVAIDGNALRVEGRALLALPVALVATVSVRGRRMDVLDIDVEGTGPARGRILAEIRGHLAGLRKSAGPIEIEGAADGNSVRITW